MPWLQSKARVVLICINPGCPGVNHHPPCCTPLGIIRTPAPANSVYSVRSNILFLHFVIQPSHVSHVFILECVLYNMSFYWERHGTILYIGGAFCVFYDNSISPFLFK